jgi:hypothetical protein
MNQICGLSVVLSKIREFIEKQFINAESTTVFPPSEELNTSQFTNPILQNIFSKK